MSTSSSKHRQAEAPQRPPRRGLFGTARDLALASIGITGVLVRCKPGPCISAASSAVGARSNTCVHGSHIPTGRTADPPGPRASAAGAHIRRLMRTKPS